MSNNIVCKRTGQVIAFHMDNGRNCLCPSEAQCCIARDTSMIERVAKAMAIKAGVPTEYMDSVWKSYIPLAEAAIAELREPTKAMLKNTELMDTPLANWKYMIDAALDKSKDAG